MARKKPLPGQLEIDQNFHEKPHVQQTAVRKKHPKRQLLFKDTEPDRGWMVAGFDVSLSVVAGAAVAWDEVLKKFKGPAFIEKRWTKEDHYFERLKVAGMAHEFILDLQAALSISISSKNVFIAEEEPWPFGLIKGGDSGWLKQQAEMSGAFLGGLVRYGFQNVSQMNTIRWRQMVANDLGITTHVSKWKDPKLCMVYNCAPANVGKFRTKQWALAYSENGNYWIEPVPNWADIIKGNSGNIPRPKNSRAKAHQPDDRYDALAICWTHYLELELDGILKRISET